MNAPANGPVETLEELIAFAKEKLRDPKSAKILRERIAAMIAANELKVKK
jgi:hypothetical protein